MDLLWGHVKKEEVVVSNENLQFNRLSIYSLSAQYFTWLAHRYTNVSNTLFLKTKNGQCLPWPFGGPCLDGFAWLVLF